MISEEPRLGLHHLVSGKQLDIYAVSVDGKSEVFEFLRQSLEHDRRLYSDIKNMLSVVADEHYTAPDTWFRRIRAWPDQWEIRKAGHRLLGFVVGQRLMLCLHRVKQKQSLRPQDFQRVDSLRSEWIEHYE
jgi:hypothetical protein